MSVRDSISSELADAWTALNSRWQGEDAAAFYRMYVLQMRESADRFESACTSLDAAAEELMKELTLIEQTIE